MVNMTRKSFKLYILWVTGAIALVFLMWPKPSKQFYPIIIKKAEIKSSESSSNLKYILVWTTPSRDPIMNLLEGKTTFINRNCPVTNCYVSPYRNFFDDITKFDVVIFHSSDFSSKDIPKSRSTRQKYVFASMESADYYPACDVPESFFNWTWTYKLNSDEEYGYISIWNKDNEIIGPKEVMQWKKVEDMDPIDNGLKEKLDTKKYAAAWFVSNCNTRSKREEVVEKLKQELVKYDLVLDIYGTCGTKTCPRFKMTDCLELVQRDYYFYLSFENSLSADYVTEKLLHALQNYAVPIVFGGANYTRFMPDGIYLDAQKLSISQLAEQMAELIKDKEKYYSYFKWHNHYSYHDVIDSPESDAYCKLCAMANDEQRFNKTSVYYEFMDWWSTRDRCMS